MTRNNFYSQLNQLWVLLEQWREHYPEGVEENDKAWNDACTAMTWIEEDLEAAYEDTENSEDQYEEER
jgi:hypothetical protein